MKWMGLSSGESVLITLCFNVMGKIHVLKRVIILLQFLQNIVEVQGEIYFVGFSFSIAVDVYKYALPSSYLGIIKVSNQNMERQCFPITQIVCKCWLMADGDTYVCVPLLHSIPLFK